MMQLRALLDRLDMNSAAGLVLWLALVVSLISIPLQFVNFALPVLPLVRLSAEPETQTRVALGEIPYRVLIESHKLLPTDATVLLVTDGTDVRHLEYTTYHRALYYLTPRPVWWLAPAPDDGTWEARWWHSAPLTESAIRSFAHSKQTDFVLLFAAPNLFRANQTLARWNNARLVQIDGGYIRSAQPSTPEFAPADGLWRIPVALALFAFNGVLVLSVLERFGIVLGLGEWLALSWCAGVGVVTFFLLGSISLGLSLANSLWIAGLTAVLGAALAGYRLLRPWRLKQMTLPGPHEWFSLSAVSNLALLAVLVLQTVYVALIAVGQPLIYWDSWVTWTIKARALFFEQTLSTDWMFETSRAVTHLDYPLLLPLSQASLFQLLGAPDDRFVGWIAIAFFISLLSLVYTAARMFGAASSRALLATAVVGALPTLSLLAAENYAEVPLAVYGTLTATYLLRWIERGQRGTILIAVTSAACLAWTKREGFALALAISASVLLLYLRVTRGWRGAAAVALAGGIVSVIWGARLAAQGITNTDSIPLTPLNLIEHLPRIPAILYYFSRTLASVDWAFVWFSAVVILFFRLVRRGDPANDLFLVAPGLYLALMGTAYIFSDYEPFSAHLANSGYRLVAQVTPLVVIWLALQRPPLPAGADSDQFDPTSNPSDFRIHQISTLFLACQRGNKR